MKYNKTKHSAAFILAALLACQPISAYAVTFSDMNQVPWPGAETSINKAAELGLVVGETRNGKSYFRPRDSVSLAESCQLAYKLLLQTGKATADTSVTEKWATVLKTYGIQEWAHPAVSFCLENDIVSITNLGSFMKNGANLPATREQAATILGRALTTGVSTYSANATTTKFADNSSISSEARPYVALLNQVSVINGDDVGKFNPKNTLNRTETAVMVTNLYNVLGKATTTPVVTPITSTQSGTVKDMNALYVNFENSNAYYLFASTGTTITLNGATSSVADLVKLFKNGTTIKATVTLDSNTRITKLVATADTKTTEENLTGTIKSLSKTSIKIGSNSYDIDDYSKVTVKINSSSKDFSDLQDLYKDGETITATLTLDKDNYVTKIVATTKSSSSSSSSSKDKLTDIKEVNNKDYEAYIKVGSTRYYIEDIDDLEVTIDGKSKDFEDLMDAYNDLDDDEYYSVSVTLDKNSDEDNYITKIRATKETEDDDDEDGTKKGTIKSLSSTKIKIGSTSYTLKSTSSLDIDVDDGDSNIDDWDELKEAYDDKKEMEVTITIKSGKVTKIKGEVVKVEGSLYSYDDDEIKVKTDSGKYTYELDDDPDEIDASLKGSSVDTLDELFEEYEDDADGDDLIVTLTLKNGKVTKVSAEWD